MEMNFGATKSIPSGNVVKPDPLDTKTPYKPFSGWAKHPTLDVPPPFAVELIGDAAMGKTHCAGTFPGAALCDTESKGWMVWEKFKNPRYYQAHDWGEVLAFTEWCLDDADVQTLVFDSSKDVRDYAEQWTLGETGKRSLVSKQESGKVIAVQFAMVYRKLDAIIHECRVKGKNKIFTTRVKPEYVDNVKTARMERDGYNKAPFQFDVLLHLRAGVQNSAGRVLFRKHIFGHVQKIGWRHYSRWPPFLVNVSYTGIVNELWNLDWRENGSVDEFIEERIRPVMDSQGIKE